MGSVGVVPRTSPLSLISVLPSAQDLCFFPAAFSGTHSASAQNVREVMIGSVLFQVAEGDITKEEGDVIVNVTNQTFNLKTGILVGIMCENSMCGRKGWVRRVGSGFFSVLQTLLFHSVDSVLFLRVQRFN